MEKTIVLGNEYDTDLLRVLNEVLEAKQAHCLEKWSGVAGSQEISFWKVEIDGQTLTIEAETYRGLSLQGTDHLVEEIATAVGNGQG